MRTHDDLVYGLGRLAKPLRRPTDLVKRIEEARRLREIEETPVHLAFAITLVESALRHGLRAIPANAVVPLYHRCLELDAPAEARLLALRADAAADRLAMRLRLVERYAKAEDRREIARLEAFYPGLAPAALPASPAKDPTDLGEWLTRTEAQPDRRSWKHGVPLALTASASPALAKTLKRAKRRVELLVLEQRWAALREALPKAKDRQRLCEILADHGRPPPRLLLDDLGDNRTTRLLRAPKDAAARHALAADWNEDDDGRQAQALARYVGAGGKPADLPAGTFAPKARARALGEWALGSDTHETLRHRMGALLTACAEAPESQAAAMIALRQHLDAGAPVAEYEAWLADHRTRPRYAEARRALPDALTAEALDAVRDPVALTDAVFDAYDGMRHPARRALVRRLLRRLAAAAPSAVLHAAHRYLAHAGSRPSVRDAFRTGLTVVQAVTYRLADTALAYRALVDAVAEAKPKLAFALYDTLADAKEARRLKLAHAIRTGRHGKPARDAARELGASSLLAAVAAIRRQDPEVAVANVFEDLGRARPDDEERWWILAASWAAMMAPDAVLARLPPDPVEPRRPSAAWVAGWQHLAGLLEAAPLEGPLADLVAADAQERVSALTRWLGGDPANPLEMEVARRLDEGLDPAPSRVAQALETADADGLLELLAAPGQGARSRAFGRRFVERAARLGATPELADAALDRLSVDGRDQLRLRLWRRVVDDGLLDVLRTVPVDALDASAQELLDLLRAQPHARVEEIIASRSPFVAVTLAGPPRTFAERERMRAWVAACAEELSRQAATDAHLRALKDRGAVLEMTSQARTGFDRLRPKTQRPCRDSMRRALMGETGELQSKVNSGLKALGTKREGFRALVLPEGSTLRVFRVWPTESHDQYEAFLGDRAAERRLLAEPREAVDLERILLS
jgi:hypothetical protein